MKKSCSKTLYPKPYPLSPKFGFTLIELLIAISIITILFSIGTAQYMKFNRQQILNQTVLELRTNLTQARNMALAGKKECDGTFDGILVKFDYGNDDYTVYSSCDNQDIDKLVEIGFYELKQGVDLSNGPAEILFKALTGGTDLDSDKTITLSLSGIDVGVKVSPSGKIELVE